MYLVIKSTSLKTYLFSIGMFLLWNFIRTGINILNFIVINHLKNYKLYKIKLYIFGNSYKILE